ncbi:hypothetical protein EUBDOL_01455 [Amedibacillus dolichus DSM 3991]|uniref:Uncharacterized protein n=1 Tax=Amedibacillus dolichus DSM 3991 TaxID=428127 RepID=A8RCN4_9FIRM|nr:hypothetical protein EUBDOL_01455 [Amedibacillus dolichus DSM 3991]
MKTMRKERNEKAWKNIDKNDENVFKRNYLWYDICSEIVRKYG